MGISGAFQVEGDNVSVLTSPTNVSGNLVLAPGTYVLSAKLFLVTDNTGDAVITCGLVSDVSGALDTTNVSAMRNRSVALGLTATLVVGTDGDRVRVRCSHNGDEAVPKAMSVKLIAIQVGGLG